MTTAQTETPLCQLLIEKFPNGADAEEPQRSEEEDSSVAMDQFLKARMDAVLQSRDSPKLLTESPWQEIPIKALETSTALPGSSNDLPPCEAPPESDSSTTTASSSQTTIPPSTPTIYNPFTSYASSPDGRSAPRTEIMGMSIPMFSLTNSPSLLPRIEVEAQPSPTATSSPDTIVKNSGRDDDDNCSLDSDYRLERWARHIRTELRHAEMVELAVEAERAADSGIKSFAAKLSTYGGDDSLIPLSAFKKAEKKRLFKRRSLSEGTKIRVRRSRSSAAKIGVMELRDVNEVFPSFGQFHSHLRTHFARSHVDERTLKFEESKSTAKAMWGGPSSPSSHSHSPSDFFKHARAPSDFFRHQRSPSELFKHRRSPSDFFHRLNFDSWVSNAASTDTVDESVVVDVLADHILTPTDKLRKLPKLVIPDGLEIPDLSMENPVSIKKRRKPRPKISEPDHQTPVENTPQHLPPKALFDQDDGLESDGKNHASLSHNDVSCAHQHLRQAEATTPRNTQVKSVPDFVTPARLRVIRDRSYIPIEPPTVESLLMTPNSVIDSGKSEDNLSSILLPKKLGGSPGERAKMDFSFKYRPSSDPGLDSVTRELDVMPLFDDDNRSSVPARVVPDSLHADNEVSRSEVPQSPERNEPLDDSGIRASPASSDNGFQASPPDVIAVEVKTPKKTRRRRVKVMIYGTSTGTPSSPNAVSGTSFGVLQHTQTLSLADSDDAIEVPSTLINEGTLDPDWTCMALSDSCSPKSMCSSLPSLEDEVDEKSPSHVLKRSPSAGALASLNTGRDDWNPFAKSQEGSKSSKPFQAAMDILSRISPRQKPVGLFLPPKDNDDFLHNYLYCSKPPEFASQRQDAEPFHETCVDVPTDMCCTTLFPDTSYFGTGLTNSRKRRSTAGPLLSLNGDAYSRMEPETWFDLATERFDKVLEQLAGRVNQNTSPWNVSFRAPTLRKKEDHPEEKARAYSIVDEGGVAEHFDDEKKSDRDDTSSQGSSVHSKHVRHLSYFPTPQGTESGISNTQFESIYGLSREAFADSLARNIEAIYQDDLSESLSGTLSSNGFSSTGDKTPSQAAGESNFETKDDMMIHS